MEESNMEECIQLPSEDDGQNIREFEESLRQSTSFSFNDIANKLLTLSVITTEECQKVEAEEETKKFELIFSILKDKGPELNHLANTISEYKDKVSEMEKQQVTQTTAHSDETRHLPYADPSEDWELKLFLKDIADNLDETDYETIKFIVKGEFGFSERRLETYKRPTDIFSCLMKCRKISRFNLLFLQSLIWQIKRKDLMRKFFEFSQKNEKKPLHFFMPSEEPVNGYRRVNVHVGGSICNLTNEEKEKIRHQVSRLLCIPLERVLLVGIQPSNSILFTFMVPEISIEIFKSLKPTIEGISVEFVEDILTITDIPLENKEPKDEKTDLEKEVKYWMEKEKKMKQELDLTLTQLLETEEELHALKEQIPLQDDQSVDKKIPVEKQERKDEKTELGKQKEDLEIEEKIPLEKQEGKDEKTELGKHLQDLEIEEKYIHLPSEDDVQNIRECEESLRQSTSFSFNDIANELLRLSVITTEEYQKVETEEEAKKFELIFSFLKEKGPELLHLANTISEYKDKVSEMEKQKVHHTTQTTARSDEIRYLPNAEASEDWELKLFLKDIADNLDETDYETMKCLVKGEIGFGEKRLEDWNGPLDLFQCLMKYRKISRFNLLYLQSLIWHTNRKDLMTKFAEFAEENDKQPLHFFMPSEEPVSGYRRVNVHIRGNIGNLTNEEKEKQRYYLSRLLCIPLELVLLDGSLKPTTEGKSVECVEDILTITDIPLEKQEPKDEKTEWEKEVKHRMEKEQKLKEESDLTSTHEVFLEKEQKINRLQKNLEVSEMRNKDEQDQLLQHREELEKEEKISK